LADGRQHDDQGGDVPSARTWRGHDDDASATVADRNSDSADTVDRADPPGVGADRPFDSLSGPVDGVKPEVVAALTQRVVRELRTVSWSAAHPPAGELAALEAVLPGGAERAMQMAEKALDAEIEVDTTLAHGDVASIKRSQWQTFVVVGGAVASALVTALLKLPWQVSVAFLTAPVFEFGSNLVRTIREPRHGDGGATKPKKAG
jgi:hypothetical protein